MKKILSSVLLTALLGTVLSSCAGKEEKLIMITEPGFAPYEYIDGSEIAGIDVDIAREIAKELGMELEIQQSEFAGALIAVQEGRADFVAAGVSINPERQESMDFTIEYATSKQVIVTQKENSKVAKVADLTGDIKIGVQQGTVADYYVADDLKMTPAPYDKYVLAAEDLKLGRIDAIIMDELPAKEMVKSNADTLVILEEEVFEDKYAIGVQKGNQELLDKLNPILQKLIDNGKIDEFTLNHTTNRE